MTIYNKILCALILLFTWMTCLCFGNEPITEERLRQIIKEENEKLETRLRKEIAQSETRVKQEIAQVKAVLEARIENLDFRIKELENRLTIQIKELDNRQTIQIAELDKRLNIQTQWIQWGLVFPSAIVIVLIAAPVAYNLYRSYSESRTDRDFEDSINELRNSMRGFEQKLENYQKTFEQTIEKVLAEKNIERP